MIFKTLHCFSFVVHAKYFISFLNRIHNPGHCFVFVPRQLSWIFWLPRRKLALDNEWYLFLCNCFSLPGNTEAGIRFSYPSWLICKDLSWEAHCPLSLVAQWLPEEVSSLLVNRFFFCSGCERDVLSYGLILCFRNSLQGAQLTDMELQISILAAFPLCSSDTLRFCLKWTCLVRTLGMLIPAFTSSLILMRDVSATVMPKFGLWTWLLLNPMRLMGRFEPQICYQLL